MYKSENTKKLGRRSSYHAKTPFVQHHTCDLNHGSAVMYPSRSGPDRQVWRSPLHPGNGEYFRGRQDTSPRESESLFLNSIQADY